MRTILVYSLAIFYFLISIRLTTNIHYCGGKIQKVSVLGYSDHKSCCAGKPMKNGCCKDVQVCFKKSSLDHQTSVLALSFYALVPEAAPVFIIEQERTHYVPKNIAPSIHAPPPESVIPIHIKNCVFII